ncbi:MULTISPECIES: YncE family protein [Prevotella]|uniref:Uncharacterized protein n=1 Tax=Prevotella herbatica TaxID=2801997 RepID=A0ABM7P1R8_9BACT|nr:MULTISPECIES: DUF5074 domain-containing protein [Prevotella]MDN5553897.1 hypothetical protein [Prevotella sp.]BCS86727.1 hypothetical protein prwr041_26200 [Prevotella herbatica]
MNRKFLNVLFLVTAILGLASCGEDDKYEGVGLKAVSDGAYVVAYGTSTNPANLSYIDYKNSESTTNVFTKANGSSLGTGANDGLVYGSKMYIVVDGSATIEVVDKTTLKSIKQIKTTDLLGTDLGTNPRHIIAGNGKIYFTTYHGVVAAVDTTTYALANKYTVGSYPEGLVGAGNYIYVANSNYGMGKGTISAINLTNGSVDTQTISGVTNPVKLFYANNSLYVLDYGSYDANYKQVGAGVKLISGTSSTTLFDATMADLYQGNFYFVNAAYKAKDVTYGIYTLATKTTTAFAGTVDSPAQIAVDPITGRVFIASNSMNADNSYPDYNKNGYVREFTSMGTKVKDYVCGASPTAIFFNYGYEKVN